MDMVLPHSQSSLLYYPLNMPYSSPLSPIALSGLRSTQISLSLNTTGTTSQVCNSPCVVPASRNQISHSGADQIGSGQTKKISFAHQSVRIGKKDDARQPCQTPDPQHLGAVLHATSTLSGLRSCPGRYSVGFAWTSPTHHQHVGHTLRRYGPEVLPRLSPTTYSDA
jgi:hypothetical protein